MNTQDDPNQPSPLYDVIEDFIDEMIRSSACAWYAVDLITNLIMCRHFTHTREGGYADA
jgi:hypothetical protein